MASCSEVKTKLKLLVPKLVFLSTLKQSSSGISHDRSERTQDHSAELALMPHSSSDITVNNLKDTKPESDISDRTQDRSAELTLISQSSSKITANALKDTKAEPGGSTARDVEEHILLEWGNMSLVSKPAGIRIIETASLSQEHLSALFLDKTCVLRIRNYISDEVCKRIKTFLTEKDDVWKAWEEGRTIVEEDIREEDIRCVEVNSVDEEIQSMLGVKAKFTTGALTTIRSYREAALPYMSPIDKLRLDLDENWPEKILGINRMKPDSVESPQIHPLHIRKYLRRQFVAYMYMEVPASNYSELAVYNDLPISTELEEYNKLSTWRTDLKKAKVKVRYQTGDLLMFNNQRPHSFFKLKSFAPVTSVNMLIELTGNKQLVLWV